MNTSMSTKRGKSHQSSHLIKLMETKRFNEILLLVVGVAAVLVILWA